MASLRCFIAVDLEAPEPVRGFASAVARTEAPMKLVDLDVLHMTLKFLGDTEEALVEDVGEAMNRACQGVAPIQVSMQGSGAFPNLNHIKVVWIGLTGADTLKEIARALDDELAPLGFSRERRPFRPHVTIARVKGGRNKDRLQAVLREYSDSSFGEQTIDAVALKKSVLTPKGPIYTTLRERRLA